VSEQQLHRLPCQSTPPAKCDWMGTTAALPLFLLAPAAVLQATNAQSLMLSAHAL
jgi:hypothetical protein